MALMNFSLPFSGSVAPSNWITTANPIQPHQVTAVNDLLYSPEGHQVDTAANGPQFYKNDPYSPPTQSPNQYQRQTYHYRSHATANNYLPPPLSALNGRPPPKPQIIPQLQPPFETPELKSRTVTNYQSHHQTRTYGESRYEAHEFYNENISSNLNNSDVDSQPPAFDSIVAATPQPSPAHENLSLDNNDDKTQTFPANRPTYTQVQAGHGSKTQVHAVLDYDNDEYYDEENIDSKDPSLTPIQGPIFIKNGSVPVVPLLSYPTMNNGTFIRIPIWWTALSVALGLEIRGDVIKGTPCVKRHNQLFCPTAGNSYPIDRIEEFIDDNKALMRRMYGDFRSTQFREPPLPSSKRKRDAKNFDNIPGIPDITAPFNQKLDLNADDTVVGGDSFFGQIRQKRQSKQNKANQRNPGTNPTNGPNPSTEPSSGRVDACESKIEIVTPYWASNSAGKIRAIVNTQHFEQAIHQEVCTKMQTNRCGGDCGCEQKYKWHRLLAYDPDNDYVNPKSSDTSSNEKKSNMITNQSNYPDKNHKSATPMKLPLRKSIRANHLHATTVVTEPQQKYPLVSIHENIGDSRDIGNASIQSNAQYKQSRIPTTAPTTTSARNFNQISNASTNLWNGIYEKHLLNQTKFEQIVDDKWANKCASNIVGRKNRETTGVTNTQPSETNFNNNLCQNELRTFASIQPKASNNVETNLQSALLRRHIDPQLTFAESCMQKKNTKNVRFLNRPPILTQTPEHQQQYFHKQINNFDLNGVQALAGKILPEKVNKSASNDLHLGPAQTNVIRMQTAEQKHRLYAYPNDTQISNEMGFMYVQPSIIEKNPFYPSPRPSLSSSSHLYNGHSEINDCQPYKNVGVLNQAYNRISGNICLERSQRGQPVGGNQHREDSSVPVNGMDVAHGKASASLSVVSGVNGRFACNTFTNAITSSAASGGESMLATNSEYTSNSKINIMLETAQAMAAAAYFARAAQRMANNNTPVRSRVPDIPNAERGGFCGALQRIQPSMPAVLARRLANKENYGLGKVKVMLRISESALTDGSQPHYLSIDKKKRQITLTDPTTTTALNSAATQDRAPKVAAPKIFAFDNLFTDEDAQSDVTSSALSEVIPAVLEGTDGCLLTLGYAESGQSKTMFGSLASAKELGAIPCAISWLYKGINERRQKTGARFSVRVSALGVSATKPGSSSKDLLTAHATESDESPSVYLRDDFLGGPTELRAPTAERAALFLDSALTTRIQGNAEPAIIFTLHVYQYSLAGKGGVAGGRSRLHLINMGGCANRLGGFPLSGIGNTLFAILGGQKHTPNQNHPLTPLLKDCLGPITCHVTILAHITCSQTHADVLTTVQVASRIHRMRRRKHRLPLSTQKALGFDITGHFSSSDGPDPSSSDLSADTVIYCGPGIDDATDGEHPPVYIPSINSGDNRCSMNKALKGSSAEKPSKLPQKKISKPQSPVPNQRTDSLKRRLATNSSPVSNEKITDQMPSYQYNPSIPSQTSVSLPNSPKIIPAVRHTPVHISSPKGSPLRRASNSNHGSPKRTVAAEEQWIDGPRLSKFKVAEARHLMREINHVKKCETWIDGPKMSPSKSIAVGGLPATTATAQTYGTQTYGYMDNHKKIMIRQWVENQTNQVFNGNSTPSINTQSKILQMPLARNNSDDEEICIETTLNEITESLCGSREMNQTMDISIKMSGAKSNQEREMEYFDSRSMHSAISSHRQNDSQEDEDQDSGPSEVPPALPLIEPLSSREISHDSIHIMCSRHVSRENLGLNIQTIDCGLQVTEEEIAREMGRDHPLSALSHANMSVISSFHAGGVGDAFSDCVIGEHTRNQFDQLAQLRDLYTSQLAMAEVTPNYKINHAGSVYSEPAFRLMSGPGSVCSEPVYRAPSPRCRDCRQSMTLSRTPSQSSLPSLNGFMKIGGLEQYASLRHPDGASDPNIKQKSEQISSTVDSKIAEILNEPTIVELIDHKVISTHSIMPIVSQNQVPQLQPLSLSTPEAYDSGHDSSTPRTSKHSGISRRAESGYHSVATARDGDDSSFGSGASHAQRITMKKRNRQEKSLCNWLKNPFTCTQPDTEGEISDF